IHATKPSISAKIVCLHDLAFMTASQRSHQRKRVSEGSDVPTFCGSQVEDAAATHGVTTIKPDKLAAIIDQGT
ncbi:MAG TPA: hypothetical protein VFJ19_08675, partial [Nocardioidaceae bacterium]|nr:hypothetical protein [Nocardioidaceae bacterium]